MKRLNKSAVFGLLLISLMGLSGCIGQDEEVDPELATFTFGSIQEPTTLDPAAVYDGSDRITTQVYEGLARYVDGTFELEQNLATSWDISTDYKVYTFSLRDDVKFHDGEPFNAEAVKKSYVRMLTLGKGLAWAFNMVLTPEGIEVLDEYTIRFTLKQSYPAFLSMTASRYAAGIICPKSVEENEKDGDFAHEWANEHMCGTGPYKLKEWVRKQEVVTVKNPDYWRGWEGKHFETVVMQIIPEPATQRLMLEQGEIDAALHIGIDDMNALKQNSDIKIMGAEPGQSTFNFFVIMNTRKGLLQDPIMREALSYAFSYSDCVENVFEGQASQAIGLLPAAMPYHDEDLFVFQRDIQKAKSLLADAGHADGGFSLTVGYMAGQDAGTRILSVLTSDLAELGISLDPQPKTWSAMMDSLVSQDTAPDLVIVDYWPDYLDSGGLLTGICEYYFWGGREEADYWYYNQDLVDLLSDAALETDPDRQDQILKSIQELLVEDMPAIWVLDLLYKTAIRSNVNGFVYNSMLEMTYNVYDMWKV